MPTCKHHKDNPAVIYLDCIGCEIDRLQKDRKRLITKVKELEDELAYAHETINELMDDKILGGV